MFSMNLCISILFLFGMGDDKEERKRAVKCSEKRLSYIYIVIYKHIKCQDKFYPVSC